MTPKSRADAEKLDAADPLRAYRECFDLPEGVIYLDGNSLGPPTKKTLARLRQTAEEDWRRDLVKAWNTADWIDLPKTCGAKIARLIDAEPDEVIFCDSVSVNIFKLAAALMDARPGALAYECDEFPTDGYILQGLAQLTGAKLTTLNPDAPHAMADQNISVLIKSAVNYKTAAVADIIAWEKAAAAQGVSIIWDLSHAAGIVRLDLKAAGARYAVGCGYKFLNGGPGAPAFVFASGDVAGKLRQPLSGWMGHAAPFDFADRYQPAQGVGRFASGTPPILSLSALDAALDLFADLDIGVVEAKAKALGDLFLARTAPLKLASISPGPEQRRGGHIALRFHHGYEVVQAMIARGVIGDFRTPDLMRFGFSPLFLRYTDVFDAADILIDIIKTEEWRAPHYAKRAKVI